MAKFNAVTSAQVRRKGRQRKEALPVERKAYSIEQFCQAHNLSRTGYYALKAKKMGPAETQLTPRGKIFITEEAAQAWRVRITPALEIDVPAVKPTTKGEKKFGRIAVDAHA
jgi:hypothetical protein